MSDAVGLIDSDSLKPTTLGALAEYITSGSRDWSKYYAKSGAIFIRTQDINRNRLSLDDVAYVALPERVEGKRSLVKKGDLLITITGANVGKVAAVDFDPPEAYVSQSVCLVRLKNPEIAKFIQMQLIARRGDKSSLESMAYGLGRPVLNLENIRSAPVLVGSVEQQEEIVGELDKQFSRLDEAVANLQRVKANLKRYKASVLKAAVEGHLVETEATLARREGRTYETGEQLLQRILEERRATWNGKGKYKEPLSHAPQELPDALEGWTWCSLDVVAEETLLGLDRGREQQRAEPVGVRYVKMNNVSMDGDVQTDELVYVDASQEEVARYQLANGDLLFNTRNSLELVGKVGIVRSVPIGTVFNNNLMRIRTCSGVSSVFLGYQMCAPDFRQRMEKVKKATTSVAAVYQKDLLPLPIALPPVGEQTRTVAEVDRHLSIIRDVEAEVDANLQRAHALRQATLSKAFAAT